MPPFAVLPDLPESYFNPSAIIAVVRDPDHGVTTIHLDGDLQLVTRLHPVQIMSGLQGGSWDVDPTQPLPPPVRTQPAEPSQFDILRSALGAAFGTFVDVANAALNEGPAVEPPAPTDAPNDDASSDDGGVPADNA